MVGERLNSQFDGVELTLCERVSCIVGLVEISWQLESVHRALLEWRLTGGKYQVPCDGSAEMEIWYRIF